MLRIALLLLSVLILAACGSTPKRGGYYKDDGPLPNPPADLQSMPDAVPRVEPIRPGTAKPYAVLGRSYTPMTALAPFKERGLASWYGRKFHGSATASGEIYDMYKMTAAHKTLPIPSYARVTNLSNGRSVIVRINDRGPFHDGRVIDLSYAAAVRLDKLQVGTAQVEVELLQPDEIARLQREPHTVVAASGPTDGLFVQAGAFSVRSNADALVERIGRNLPDFAARTELIASGNLYRVLIGPFEDPGDASVASERIGGTLGADVIIVDRR